VKEDKRGGQRVENKWEERERERGRQMKRNFEHFFRRVKYLKLTSSFPF